MNLSNAQDVVGSMVIIKMGLEQELLHLLISMLVTLLIDRYY
jgi:hypothetical protein